MKEKLEHAIIRSILAKPEEKEFYTIRVTAHGRHYDDTTEEFNLDPAASAMRRAAAVKHGIAQDLRRKLTAGMPATQQPYTMLLHKAMFDLEYPTMAEAIIAECSTTQEGA